MVDDYLILITVNKFCIVFAKIKCSKIKKVQFLSGFRSVNFIIDKTLFVIIPLLPLFKEDESR